MHTYHGLCVFDQHRFASHGGFARKETGGIGERGGDVVAEGVFVAGLRV